MNFSTKSLVSVILVLGSIFVAYFFVWPKWNQYTEAKATLAANQIKQDQLKQAQAQLDNFLAEYHKHSDAVPKLNQALPLSKDEMYNVLNGLDLLSKQSALTEATIMIDDSATSDQLGATVGSIQPVDLTFTGSGTYPSFKNFLSSLESNLRITDVLSLTLGQGDNNTMRFGLKLRTYYEK